MKEERLLYLLEKNGNQFLEGRHIAKSLGISRVHLLKGIRRLEEWGYRVSFQPPDGYKLCHRPDLLTPLEVKSGLKTCFIGQEIYTFKETGSTNDVAYRLAVFGAKEGVAVVAESQRRGRGRLGRRWESPPSVNIYTSIVLRPAITPALGHQITLVSAVAAVAAIRRVTDLTPNLRWPNDITLNGKKVGGILTEMSQAGDRIEFSIIGIGINVNATKDMFPDELRALATSLKEEGGRDYSRAALVRALYEELEGRYLTFNKIGMVPIIEEWERLSELKGRRVKFICQERPFTGVVLGLDPSGCLLIREDSGAALAVPVGQVIKVEV